MNSGKKLLQYMASIFIALLAISSMSMQAYLSALLFLIAAVLILPKTQAKLKNTYLNTKKRVSYTILALIIFAFFTTDTDTTNNRYELSDEQIVEIQKEIENRRKTAISNLNENPQIFIKDLEEKFENQDYESVIDIANLVSEVDNEHVNNLHLKAEEAILKQEKEAERKLEENQQIESWEVYRGHSKMDDSRSISFQKRAENTSRGWLKILEPALVIRCLENKTDIIFNIGTSFTPVYGEYNKAKIRYRIDDNQPVTQYWSESTDNDAAFASRAISLAKALKNSERLRIEFNPFNADPAIAEFDIRGIKPHLTEVAKTCNWTI